MIQQNEDIQDVQSDAVIPTEELIPERKITQTDHVNSKLLKAFLNRLNQNDNTVAFGLTAPSADLEEVDSSENSDFDSSENCANNHDNNGEDKKD